MFLHEECGHVSGQELGNSLQMSAYNFFLKLIFKNGSQKLGKLFPYIFCLKNFIQYILIFLLLTEFFPDILHISTHPTSLFPLLSFKSLKGIGLRKTSHLGLSAPESFCTLSICGSLSNPIYCKKMSLWWWMKEALIYGYSSMSLRVVLLPCSFSIIIICSFYYLFPCTCNLSSLRLLTTLAVPGIGYISLADL